jgi:hypothetical protein
MNNDFIYDHFLNSMNEEERNDFLKQKDEYFDDVVYDDHSDPFGKGMKPSKDRLELEQKYSSKLIKKSHIHLFKNVPDELKNIKKAANIGALLKKYNIKTRNKKIGEVIDELIEIINKGK